MSKFDFIIVVILLLRLCIKQQAQTVKNLVIYASMFHNLC